MDQDLLPALGLCLGGLIVLVIGAELLVRGGSALAERLSIPPVIVGLTFVAIGTSAPELAIGIEAARQGNGGLAVGNVVGTNTVNLMLILGISAVLLPLTLTRDTMRLDLPAMLFAAGTLLVLSLDGSLSRIDGLVLIGVGFIYSAALVRSAVRQSAAARAAAADAAEEKPRRSRLGMLYEAAMLAGGIAIVVVGAEWLVDGGVTVARIWGVSDAFIGLTIVAIGTSAPELVTTIVSTIRKERDIAIGNLLGSSTYNIAFILGVACLVPADGMPMPGELLLIDIPVMVAAVLVCVPVFLSGHRVSRIEGGAFVAAYALYLAYLLIART